MDNFFNGGAILFSNRLAEDMDLGNYFASLPEEVQEAINQRAEEFHSAEEIRAYAGRLSAFCGGQDSLPCIRVVRL